MKTIQGILEDNFTNTKFNAELDEAVTVTESWIKKGQDGVVPMLVINMCEWDGKGEAGKSEKTVAVLADMPDSHEDRIDVFRMLGKKAYQELSNNGDLHPMSIHFISEAWIKQMEKGEEPDRKVSEYDDKEEVVIVVGSTLDQRHNMATIKVDRDSRGQLVLGDTESHYYTGPEDQGEYPLLNAFYKQYTLEYVRADDKRKK